jgi:predicted alpha/beta hydrolase family esterase
MKNAVVLHGLPDEEEYYDPDFPAQSNAHWIGWLQKQLQRKDIFTQTPEMPLSFKPDYKVWKKEFERYDITPETLLVGHSCGGGFLIRWLSENKDTKVGKVILVAPWLNPDNLHDTGSFFDFEIDPSLVSRTTETVIFRSSNDFGDVLKSIDIMKDKIKDLTIREFQDHGHFCKRDLGTEAFPELLEECLATS